MSEISEEKAKALLDSLDEQLPTREELIEIFTEQHGDKLSEEDIAQMAEGYLSDECYSMSAEDILQMLDEDDMEKFMREKGKRVMSPARRRYMTVN